jgi:type VI protein secretion system component Hcp
MKKFSILVVCTIWLAAGAWAQNGRDSRSTILVTVNGMTCSTPAGTGIFSALTWGFGASTVTSSNPGGGGVSSGKPTLTNLTISKHTDSCSPVLFEDVIVGRHISQVTIVQQDSHKDDVFQVTLKDVLISNYQLSGNQSEEVPTEQISFSYTQIILTDLITGTKFGWDLKLNKGI